MFKKTVFNFSVILFSILISSLSFAGLFDAPRPDEETGLVTRPANSARIYGISALYIETIVEIDGQTVKDISHGYVTIYVKPGNHSLVVKLGNKQIFKNDITLKADEEYFFVIKPVLGGQMEFVADKDKFFDFYDDYDKTRGKKSYSKNRKRANLGMFDLTK
jgi:hypothetical protein